MPRGKDSIGHSRESVCVWGVRKHSISWWKQNIGSDMNIR